MVDILKTKGNPNMNAEAISPEENVLNVLIYLFKNHMRYGCKLDIEKNSLLLELCHLGFQHEYIGKALNWISELVLKQDHLQKYPPQKKSIHIFDVNECLKLDKSSRNLILRLENFDILNPLTRELIISQAMQLDIGIININHIKWVIAMVLFNHPDKKKALTCKESLFLIEIFGRAKRYDKFSNS